MNEFYQKINDPRKRMVLYEFLPPETHTTRKALVNDAITLVKDIVGYRKDLDALLVPKIIDESERGINITRPDRLDARTFAAYIRQNDPNNTEIVISYPFRSIIPKEKTEEWIKETAHEYHIGNIIVVGPAKDRADLTGYSVNEVLKKIQTLNSQDITNICAGAICIDKRRKIDSEFDEPKIMVAKIQSGAQFFQSQIFDDPKSVIHLLKDYSEECLRQDIEPKRVFLSVCPIPSKGTLNLVQSFLEREINPEIAERIFTKKGGEGHRSVEVIEEHCRRIFDYCYGSNLNVPLGLNIEHVSDGNFRYTKTLLHRLPEVWRDYLPDSENPFEYD